MAKWQRQLRSFRFGKPALLAVIVLSFLGGYNLFTSQLSVCSAQGQVPPAIPVFVVGGGCFLSTGPYCAGTQLPCEMSGTAADAHTMIGDSFNTTLEMLTDEIPPFIGLAKDGTPVNSGYGLEGYLGGTVDQMMMALLDRLNDIELEYIDWWDTMWYYNMEPAWKDQTDQVNTATAHQTTTFQGGQDGQDTNNVNQTNMTAETTVTHDIKPSENGPCVAATAASGSGRGYNLSRELRKAMQHDWEGDGLNHKGSPSAAGRGAKAKKRNDDYKNITCNPDDNGGDNNCGSSTPALYNADTQLSKTLYNNLTIPLDGADGDKYETATKALLDNMTGDPVADPVVSTALTTPEGKAEWMDRRSYMARMAAIRSIPQLGISWRSPGTRLGDYVKQLRQAGGADLPEISSNPSYLEAVHAVSVDRFNSGKYATDNLTSPAEVEMEKLTLDSFYLMQLRDYEELMERLALTLSVQVALMADNIQLTVPQAQAPVR